MLRKINQQLNQTKKLFCIKNDGSNAILINSFPKSGTHLLYQLFEKIPNVKKFNTFIASMPSYSQLERRTKKTTSMINSIVCGELVRSHLFFGAVYDDLLVKNKIIHYFIYRDPRDVVISEANYLYDMNKWHRLHKYFKKFTCLDDRIMFSIKGDSFFNTPVIYPNITKRFERYKSWLGCDSVYSVKYEALNGDSLYDEIKTMMSHYLTHSNTDLALDELVRASISNINPKKSQTFRDGGIHQWKKYFNEKHKETFKEIAGDLLIELGYEKNLNW